jgi:hypothetical protein
MHDKRRQKAAPVNGKVAIAAAVRPAAAPVTVLDTVFLDEPADPVRARPASREPSSYDSFADEDAVPHAASSVVNVNTMVLPLTALPAEVAAPQLSPSRPSLLVTLSLLAALAAFATVRACQTGGVTPVAIWQLFGF